MRQDTKKKALAAVLVLGLGAVGIDRFILGGGGPAEAGASDLLIERPTDGSAEAAPSRRNTVSVARQLEGLAEGPETDPADLDAFALPPTWVVQSPEDHAGSAEPLWPTGRPPRLTTVISRAPADPGAPSVPIGAIIDNRSIRIGDQVDGMTLVTLTAETAVFAGAGRTVELRLVRTDGPDRMKR